MSVRKNEKVPVVIPAYQPNEQLLELCERLAAEGLTNVVIVDDGGGADYRAIFTQIQEKYGFPVLVHPVNQGKGRALKDAFQWILTQQPEAVGCVTADSDGQHSPGDILKCIHALQENPQALVLGCRDFSQENVPAKSKFGNEMTRKVFGYLCGVKISDTQTGLRGIPAAFMQKLLSVEGERFEFETNMLIACGKKIPIVEVPIQTIYDSKEDHQTHFDPIRDSIRIYRPFVKMFVKYIFASLSSCVVDLVLFSIFCSLLIGYAPAWYITIATVLARVISATYNCMVNYFLVFRTDRTEKKVRHSVVQYYALAAVQMLVSAGLVTVLAGLLTFLPVTVVKMFVDVTLFFVSYYIQRNFIF